MWLLIFYLTLKGNDDELVYKPLIQRSKFAFAYGKKIKLQHAAELTTVHGEQLNTSQLIQDIHQQGNSISVNKEALIYKFQTHPSTKLELARLDINQQIYFSVNIESSEQIVVEYLAQQMIGDDEPSDYVTFLKNRIIRF